MRIVVAAAGFLAVAYLVLVGVLWTLQRRLLFPAGGIVASAAEAGLVGFEDVVVPTADGERLAAWWKPPLPGRALVVYLHGNGGSLWNRRERARLLTEDGRGLLLVTYRGYPGSTGSPSETGLRLDAEAASRFVSGYAPHRVVLYGESLGTGVAVWLAAHRPVGAVILDAPFTSIADVAQPLLRIVPVALLLRDGFRSIDRIAAIGAPLLVMHGERDGIIPIALGERLYAAAREPKRFLRLPGVDHVSVLETGGLAAVRMLLDDVEARLAAEPVMPSETATVPAP